MSGRSFRNSPFLLLPFLLAAASPEAAAPDAGKREPIVITANRMEADKLGDVVVFVGRVVLKKEGMTLNTDHLTVHYDPPARGVREIDAVGNVVVTKEGRVALAERAVYYSKEEKIVLTGDARIIENENQLGGERITLFLRDDRSIVEGGRVLIYQEQGGKPGGRAGRDAGTGQERAAEQDRTGPPGGR